jgi:YqaJ-like viral recombinase domain
MRIMCKEQHTAEWYSARCGKVSASCMKSAIAKLSRASKNGIKGDWAAAHITLVSELAWEMITGVPADHYVSKPMEIGTQFEGEARIEYWMRYGTEVDETGFVLHPRIDWIGCSPDGLVGKDGGLEIKVPLFKTHCGYLEDPDSLRAEYEWQCLTGMLCCTDDEPRPWWDLISYCPPDIAPELPDEFRMCKVRVEADRAKFDEIEDCATKTIEEAVALVSELTKRFPKGSAPAPQPRKQRTAPDDYDHSKSFADQDHSYLDGTLAECP